MKEYKKPLPEIQPWSKPFWDGAKQHKLLIQECKTCKSKIFYPRKYCPECWSSEVEWIEATGKAKVYAHTITLTGVEEKFTEDLPYVLAMVDLEEGVRMLTKIVETKPEDVEIGMDVTVVFEDVTEEISLPLFKPSSQA